MKNLSERDYVAFISYSHSDEATASWLHKSLEAWRAPAGIGLEMKPGRRLGRVFRDRLELTAGDALSEGIETALRASACLIVLCSPRSAVSRYVQLEIETFRAAGGERIIPVILEGDPPDCYPPALRAGPELLCADIRTGRDGRKGGLTKVVAGILGVPFDRLAEREKVARRNRLMIGGGIAAVSGLALALTTGLWLATAVQERAARAGEAIESARLAFADGKTAQALEHVSLAASLGSGASAESLKQVSEGWLAGYPDISTILARRTSNVVSQAGETLWIHGNEVYDLNLRGNVTKIEDVEGARGVAWNRTGDIRFFNSSGVTELKMQDGIMPLLTSLTQVGSGRYIAFGLYPSGSVGSGQPLALLIDLGRGSLSQFRMSALGHEAQPLPQTTCEALVISAAPGPEAGEELAAASGMSVSPGPDPDSISVAVLADVQQPGQLRSPWCSRWSQIQLDQTVPYSLEAQRHSVVRTVPVDRDWPDRIASSLVFSGTGAFLRLSRAPVDDMVNRIDREFDPFGFDRTIVDDMIFRDGTIQILGGPPGGTATGTLRQCFASLEDRSVSHCHEADSYNPGFSELSPDGRTILSGHVNSPGIEIVDSMTLKAIPVSEETDDVSRGGVRSTVSFTPDGTRLFALTPATGTVVWYDLKGEAGTESRRALLVGTAAVPGFGQPVTARTQGGWGALDATSEAGPTVASLTIRLEAIDQERILLVRGDGSTALFDVSTGTVVWRGAGTGLVSTNSWFAISQDRSTIALSVAGVLQIINVETGLPVAPAVQANLADWPSDVMSATEQQISLFRMDVAPLRFVPDGLQLREPGQVLFVPLRAPRGTDLACLFPPANLSARARPGLANQAWRRRCGLSILPPLMPAAADPPIGPQVDRGVPQSLPAPVAPAPPPRALSAPTATFQAPAADCPPTGCQPSFDCSSAERPVERLICSSPELSANDREIARLFQDLRAQFAGTNEERRLRRSQIDWIVSTRGCPDTACVAELQRQRIDQLASGAID